LRAACGQLAGSRAKTAYQGRIFVLVRA